MRLKIEIFSRGEILLMYYVYILKCFDSSYYVGSTDKLLERARRHNQKRGANFTSKRTPCVIVWFKTFKNRHQAIKRELEIKKFSRQKKEKLIFSEGSVWRHYKGNKYIILGRLDNLIVYSRLDIWKRFVNNKSQSGEQCEAYLRSSNQWLDWIDKNKNLLRLNLVSS